MNGLQTCSSFLDLTGNPVKCRSGPAAVRGANVDTPLGRNLWEGGKSYEPEPEDLPVLRSPLASETFGRLHLRKTGRGSGDSRASVLAQHFRFFAGVFERPENEPHCISQSICPPFADRFIFFYSFSFMVLRKQ